MRPALAIRTSSLLSRQTLSVLAAKSRDRHAFRIQFMVIQSGYARNTMPVPVFRSVLAGCR